MHQDNSDSVRQLPPELDSLVHHLELNRSGWWDQALQTLVLATCWLNAPTTQDELIASLTTGLGGRLTVDRAEQFIGAALADGSLLETADGQLKVSEELAESFHQQLQAVRDRETRLHERFVEIVCSVGVDADPEQLWIDMVDLYLRPLVSEAGARMYRVITSAADVEQAVTSYDSLVSPICDEYGPDIRPALIEFLDPSDSDVRQYILQMINANFVREASSLNESVLERLTEGTNSPQRLRIYLDTNFLFSFLELHDNPANAVAQDLMDLIEQCRSRIGIDLYVLPITIDEARRVLRGVTNRLESIAPTRNMALAAREFTSTGLVAKYLEAASRTTERLRPNDFFGPYDSDLPSMLRDRGVKLHNDSLDSLRTEQDVVDDLADLEERQQFRPKGPKPYESNLHDAVILRFCQRRRPAHANSPLELGEWVCTLDYGLIGFDRHKSRENSRPPICLTPGALVQLLQFWVPRSEEFDRALVGSFRQPLLFLNFDTSSEQTTIDILRTLSRYENVDDLPEKTLFRVVSNETLRARLESMSSPSMEESVEAVEAAIVEEARLLDEQRAKAERQARAAAEAAEAAERIARQNSSEVEQWRAQFGAKAREAERLQEESVELSEELKRRSDEVAALRTQSAEKTGALEDRLRAVEQSAARSKETTRLVVASIAMLIVALPVTTATGLALEGHVAPWLAWAAPIVAAISAVVIAMERLVRSNVYIGKRFQGFLGWLKTAALFVLAAAFTGVIGNLAYDGLQESRLEDVRSSGLAEGTPHIGHD